MWQRIQTLYLFLSFGLVGSLFFCKFTPEESFTDYVPYLILLIIISLFNLLALTCYKHRIFQMRTAAMAALITLGFQIWLAVDFFSAKTPFYLTAIFPIVAVILDVLAARSILADEMMVRSASRLRSSKRKK